MEEQNRKENTPKEFRGKEYTVYEAKQRQRQMETAMRAQRQKVQLLKEGGADPDEVMLAKCKYQGQLDEYARFSKKMGIKQERERIYLDVRGRVAPERYAIKLSDSTDKWAKEARRELLIAEKSISGRSKEVLELYGANGKYILTKRGNMNSVRLSVLDYPKLKGAVVTHNHPSGGSFSYNDIRFLKNMPVSEIRVATIDGVYYMRKPGKWPSSISNSADLEKAINDIRKELRPKYVKLYNKGKITKVQRHTMFSNEVNRVFSERYGLEYGRETYE